MKKKYLILILFCISGCSNTIEKFYSGMSPQESINLFGENKNQSPIIHEATNSEEIYNMAANGFVIIGYSMFNTANINKNEILKFGKKINAEVITIAYQYTHTVNSVTPIIIPNFSNTNTTIRNNYGLNIANIDSNTTNYSTQYIQSSINRYDYQIIFWRKYPSKPKLGLRVVTLTQKEKLKIQSNKGVSVVVVANGSPAYKHDILPYDIITKINDKDIYSPQDLHIFLANFKGKILNIEIIRNNKLIKKIVKLD